MLVVFEGIDGSGKTTLSNRVAGKLEARGLRVRHVRAGGRLASAVAEGVRQFTRDQRNVLLTPFCELLLYVAREAQQLEEVMLPALATADVVIADRFLFTAEVLARAGRGLPMERIAPVIAAARQGVIPDLTVLVDVDPHVARARRRADKIARPEQRTSSRKGLSGAGLIQRLRDGYRDLAASEPQGWIVVDNTAADLEDLTDALADAIVAARAGGGTAAARRVCADSGVATATATAASTRAPIDIHEARARFLGWIDARSTSEPEVAAYMLYGLGGGDFDAPRVRLAGPAPAVVAYGLRGLDDEVSWELRHFLASVCPAEVARSLGDTPVDHPDAWELRAALAFRSPAAVALSLDGQGGEPAWALRERLWAEAPDAVVASLGGDASDRAWALRERWLELAGGEMVVAAEPRRAAAWCASVRGLCDARAWAARKRCRPAAPVAAILSLEGVDDERAWRWRERFLARAPRPVLRTIDGVAGERAHALREAVVTRCKESIDSLMGLGDERSWRLRDQAADLWPSTVVKSLGPLAETPRGQALIRRQLAHHPANLSLWKHVAAVASGATPRRPAYGL
jgi:dTMP kinase